MGLQVSSVLLRYKSQSRWVQRYRSLPHTEHRDVRSLGADPVLDYTREDFVQDAGRYDLILDNAQVVPYQTFGAS
jgi:hypothetical protein